MSADFDAETWVYAGRRVLSTGKLGYAWLDGKLDTELLFGPHSKATVVGGIYNTEVKRDGDRTTMRLGQFTGERHPDDVRTALLQAKDRAAYEEQQQSAAERKLAADGPLEQALAPLLAIAATCKTYSQITALEAEVIRRLRRATR